MNPQQVRLREELRRLQALAAAHPQAITIVKWDDDPPTWYSIDLHCRGGASFDEDKNVVTTKKTHRVQIDMGSKYPVHRPAVHVESPFFNPHIFPSGAVCLGGAWSKSETLDIFVQRLWGLLVWDPNVIDEGSPADSDAMLWYRQHKDEVPFDRIDLTQPPSPAPAPEPTEEKRKGIIWRE